VEKEKPPCPTFPDSGGILPTTRKVAGLE